MLAEMYKDVYSDIPFDRMGSLTYIKSHKNVHLYGSTNSILNYPYQRNKEWTKIYVK